jgi:hypothetical protein
MPAPELQFYTNLVAPGITENGQDVINAQELETALSTKGYLTGNQSISISGDVTGTGTTSISLTLASSGVVAGTYTTVTVDSKGRVTAGSNGSSSYTIVTSSANYNVTTNDGVILANGAITITLPSASTVTGKTIIIKRISNSGPVTVNVTSNGTIDGYNNITIDQIYTSLTIVSNGTSWWII